PAAPDRILEVLGLTVAYASDDGPVIAVDDVDFDVGRGEFLGIVGESGCGKSTLLYAIARLLGPPFAGQIMAGQIVIQGRDIVAQRSLMMQIKELQERLRFAVVFVTHDMSLVSHFSDRVLVMYAAQVAEFGRTRQIFEHPRHPYTQALLDAFPSIRGPKVHLAGIPGSPPDLARPPAGCRFAPRCPHVMPRCTSAVPPLFDVDRDLVRC